MNTCSVKSEIHFSKIHLCLILVSISAVFMVLPLANVFMQQETHGFQVDRPAPLFSLFDAKGHRVSLHDFHGQYIYLMFGFLRCEAVCHSQVAELAALSAALADENVQFLYLAMDSLRDDPVQLQGYFDQLGSSFKSLHAKDIPHMQSIASAFNAEYRINGNPTGDNFDIEHPAQLFLIDDNSQLRLIYRNGSSDISALVKDYFWLYQGKQSL